jgi:uncharacterized protein YqeY
MAWLPDIVQADLLVARKARDEHAVTALRTLLAALANAEAPPAPPTSSLDPKVLGTNEVDRLVLTEDDHRRILDEQIAAREDAADEYDALGQNAAADRLRAEGAVLQRYR